MTAPRRPPPRRREGWRPPTRRAFVAMLGAAAATLALKPRRSREAERPGAGTAGPAGKPIWIGHF